MKIEDHVSEIRSRGYSLLRGIISKELVGDYRTRLQVLVERQSLPDGSLGDADHNMVHNPMFLDAAFLNILEIPTLIEVIDGVLGETAILYAFQTSSMPSDGTNYSRRIHVDSPRVIPNYITNLGFIIPLDDFTPENGATEFLPYSFERIDQPSEDEFSTNAELVVAEAGDLICSNARLWHRGGLNSTREVRHALTLNICRSFMRQRFDFPRMVPLEIIPKLTTVQKRLLGFQVRMPSSMAEYYVPEDRRLYLSNQG
jgi:ectoine hydroxylase-related dioxygenase (phytanoyl-CoA dioxygenase family)